MQEILQLLGGVGIGFLIAVPVTVACMRRKSRNVRGEPETLFTNGGWPSFVFFESDWKRIGDQVWIHDPLGQLAFAEQWVHEELVRQVSYYANDGWYFEYLVLEVTRCDANPDMVGRRFPYLNVSPAPHSWPVCIGDHLQVRYREGFSMADRTMLPSVETVL